MWWVEIYEVPALLPDWLKGNEIQMMIGQLLLVPDFSLLVHIEMNACSKSTQRLFSSHVKK